MQFRVVIPANIHEGEIIRIRCPNGMEGEVRVPKGLKGGDSFVFEMPHSVDEFVGIPNPPTQRQASRTTRRMDMNTTSRSSSLSTNPSNTNNNNNSLSTNTNHSSLIFKSSFIKSTTTTITNTNTTPTNGGDEGARNSRMISSSPHQVKSFLDREIVNWQDFFMALGIGMFIGMSIVFGFLLGILAVTEPPVKTISSLHNSPIMIHREMRFPKHFYHPKEQQQQQQQQQQQPPKANTKLHKEL
jgi:hypothetical protein